MLEQLNSIKDLGLREKLDKLLINTALRSKIFLGMALLNEETGREQLANELFKEYRRPLNYLKVKVFNIEDIWSADLIQMPNENQGRNGKFKFILTVIDLYSRYAWGIPLRNKSAIAVRDAFDFQRE